MSDFLNATIPFIKDSKYYPLILLYNSDDFLIASGEDEADKGHRSIGVRWHRSRNEGNKQNPLGFPLTRGVNKCWLMMPSDLALCLLNHIKDSDSCVNKDETNKAIQELKVKLKESNTKLTLRSYKMKHNTGFAPNVSGDILSVATCKPQIRRVCEIGEWIAGFSSKALDNSQVGKEKLIYLAKVSEKISFAEFWDKYPKKRTDSDRNGDNIYKPNGKGGYEQIANPHHDDSHKAKDLSADKVLLCDKFYYFGSGVDLPIDLRENLCIPQGQSGYGVLTDDNNAVQSLIDFVRANKAKCTRFKDSGNKVGGVGIANNIASSSCGGTSKNTSKC